MNLNLRSKNRNLFVFQFFLIAWIVLGSCQLWGMEVVSLAEDAAQFLKGEGIAEGTELFTRTQSAIEEQFGSLTAKQMEDLGADFRARLRNNIKEFANSVKAQKSFLEELKTQDLDSELKNLANVQKENFFAEAQKMATKGLSFDQFKVLDRIDSNLAKPFQDAKLIPGDEVRATNVGVAPEAPMPVEEATEIVSHETVAGMEKDLQDFLKNPGELSGEEFKSKVESYKKTIADAKSAYKTSAKAEVKSANDAAEAARLKRVSAKEELKKAKGDDNIRDAKKNLDDAKKGAKDANKAAREVELKQKYQDYEQAKASRDTAKQELKTAKEIFKGTEKEGGIADAQKAYDEANEKYTQASKDWKEAHSYFEGQGWSKDYIGTKLKTTIEPKLPELPTDAWAAAKGVGKGAWKGTKWVAGKGWGLTKSTAEMLFQAGAFMIPQLILDQVNAWAQKMALLDTLRSLQIFGNIKMRLPDDLIDEAEPTQSKFVYAGVPSKDQKLTKNFLDTANYYGSKSEYGDLAAYGITDPNFPHVMLHLDTGFVFVGDGVAFNDEKPTIPLLDDSDPREKDLLQTLDDLAGEVKSGPVGESYSMFSMHASGYAGDKTIAALFEKPNKNVKESYPPILQRTLTGLQNGTTFGDFQVQGFRGLATQNKNDIDMWNLLSQGSASEKAVYPAAPNDPYVGWGLYIYQTKDTPFIKNIRSTISHDDIDQAVAAQDLVDYVIMLDEGYNIVPLQTPQPQAPYNYASYTLNPDIVYMVSLLDPSLTLYAKNKKDWGVYDKDNVKKVEELITSLEGSSFKNVQSPNKDRVFSQIAQMQQFLGKQAQFGPFSIGLVTMSINRAWFSKGIYIYKVPGYLGNGIDDYVIALDRSGAVMQLPGAVGNFISLVTSRIYDSLFKPQNVKLDYYIMKKSEGAPEQVTTSQKKFLQKVPGAITACSTEEGKKLGGGTNEKAPLYTLFVEGSINPTKCNGKDLPNPPDWALNQYSFSPQDEKPLSINDFLTANEKNLQEAIIASHDAWRKSLDLTDPMIVARQMGPFNFTPEGSLQNVKLTAVSEAAIINQNFVYRLDTVPDEYFVLATDAQGTNAGEPYNAGSPQQYAVSLSTGHVYSAQAQEGKVPGERVDQKPLDLQTILARVQRSAKFSPDLLAEVQRSEQAYNARIARNLYGSNTDFAQFNFYIAKEDYLKSQYIYADVTKLGNPLDEKGNPIPSIVSQITNYFVCIERTATTEGCADGCPPVMDGGQPVLKDGKPLYWHYTFGTNISSGNTYAVASLISGASYGVDNNYLGTYDQFVVNSAKGETSITDIKGFTTRTLQAIETRSGEAIRPELKNAIAKLTDSLERSLKAEEDELAEAEAEYAKKYPALGSNLKVTLDKLPYIDNPNLLPRYLKYHEAGKKYYAVTPGYVSSPKPTDSTGKELDVPSDGPGPDRMYIDYNFDPTGLGANNKDYNMGMIYDSDGNAQVLLVPDKKWITDPTTQKRKKVISGPGWALMAARAFAGINVASNGVQTKTIGITAPSVPFGETPGSTSYLKSTGFETLVDTAHNTSFDFLYHTKLDTFFVKVTTPNKTYINLTSGYAYNPDGMPRWFESAVYTTKNSGDMIFIGNDAFDILKVALYKAATKEFSFYTMVGNFYAMKTDAPYNAKGSYCVMVNDNDPDSKIQLFQATKSASPGGGETIDKTGVPFPYYLVWDVSKVGNAESATTPVLLGQFGKDPAQAYSLLLYAQTRNKGESIEKGKFDDDDNYIDPTATIKIPKTIGIVFDTNHKITAVIYQDQLCPLRGNSITVKNSDGSTRTVTITQSKKNLLPATGPQGLNLTAEWISFEDGSKIYDYEYDLYVLSTQPEVVPLEQKTYSLNLYNLKHGDPSQIGSAKGGFGLNVTPYVPTIKHKKKPKEQTKEEPVSGVALASILDPSGNVSESDVIFPTNLSEDFKNQARDNLRYISVDDSGTLFINNLVTGKTKRFVYKLGQAQDVNKIYASPGLEGWYIDLSNGILYDPSGFPSGVSLNAPQLYTLLDTIQLSVVYDKDGNAKLMYRLMSEEQPAGKVTPSPLAAKPASQLSTVKPVKRLKSRRITKRRGKK